MALWIESHADLGRHPKTARLAKLLGISKVTAVGHLHYLWWWCMDYAQDGLLGKYSADEIADGAMWEGPADEFLAAMVAAEFIDPPISGCEICVHDWHEYGGKLVAKRKSDAERKTAARGKDVPRMSDGCPTDVRWMSQVDKTTSPTTEKTTAEDRTLHHQQGADADEAGTLSWEMGTSCGTPYVKKLREKNYTEPEIRWAIDAHNRKPVPPKIKGQPANYLAAMIDNERKHPQSERFGSVSSRGSPGGHTLQSMQAEIGEQLRVQGFKFDGD